MSQEAVPAGAARPKRSAINALASTWLAHELVSRIPEYAAYAAVEGLDTLSGQISDAMRSFTLGTRDLDAFARRIEGRTMVGAPGRTEVVLASYAKLHTDAAILLEGGWVREAELSPPFEGPYANVRIERAPGIVSAGYAFRFPDLDARGLLMVVRDRGRGYEDLPGELVYWERIAETGPAREADIPRMAARHRHVETAAKRMFETVGSKERNVERDFAEAEFREIAPVDRAVALKSLSEELARTVEEGDGTALKSVLNRLAGVTAAAAAIPDPADLVSHAPEEPRYNAPRS